MSSVDDIVAAAERLKPDQFLRLRKKLDQLEQALWEKQRRKAADDTRAKGITDDDIDRIVTRRRREGRR